MGSQRVVDIKPIVVDGKHFVTIRIDGREAKRHGAFPNANAARTAADRIVAHWRERTATMTNVVINGDIVIIPIPATGPKRPVVAGIPIGSDAWQNFVCDATRAAEGLITDQELADKYDLSPVDWQRLTKDVELIRAIRAERERRLANGTALRESAARHAIKGPPILDGILETAQNPRHKIDAFAALRQASIGSDAERPAGSERFIISIDLSGGGDKHIEHYDKSLKIDVSDGDDPNNMIPLEGEIDE